MALIGLEVWTSQDMINVSENPHSTLAAFLSWRSKQLRTLPNDNAQLITSVTLSHQSPYLSFFTLSNASIPICLLYPPVPWGNISQLILTSLCGEITITSCIPAGLCPAGTNYRWRFVSSGGGDSRALLSGWHLSKPCALTTSLVE